MKNSMTRIACVSLRIIFRLPKGRTVLLALFFACGVAQAQVAAKSESVRKYLDLTGGGRIGIQVAQSMITQFKKIMPEVPDDYWKEFQKEMKPETLIDLVVPIYSRYFTEEDMQQLIKFYESPIGKKMTEALPGITQESMMAGQLWGKELGEKVYNDLKAKGLIKEK